MIAVFRSSGVHGCSAGDVGCGTRGSMISSTFLMVGIWFGQFDCHDAMFLHETKLVPRNVKDNDG